MLLFPSASSSSISQLPKLLSRYQGMMASEKSDLAIKILGPLVIAITINTFLYGLCLMQFVKYFRSGVRDSLPMRLFVSWELFLDTFHTVVSTVTLWRYGVDNFNNEAFLVSAPWILSVTGVVSAFSVCPVQAYLSYRVKKLSTSWMPFTVLLVAIFIEARPICHFLMMDIMNSEHAGRLSGLLDMGTLAKGWTISGAITNIAISACLIFYLRKRSAGIYRTDRVISRLIRQAVETAFIAAFFSIMLLITYLQWPNTLVSSIFAFPLGRVYTNTCLAVINSRPTLRRELRDDIYPMDSVSDRRGRDSFDSINELTRLTTEMDDAIGYESDGDG
ncbi:hypothetical protein D9757_013189 [Collybiopsis confluens]|uniref:DUF6534 domain-containing protein n=1 Tax=Collybiopsis confluens TaxID=2823264 RepID=A0A8H5CYC2_9AGAR|nr:hypothetical protein D9757_013189 [Collybiopsis confluens]